MTDDTPQSREPSELAQRINRLKKSVLDSVRERERLPQPLFWSLFNHEIQDIKRDRAIERQRRKILLGVDL